MSRPTIVQVLTSGSVGGGQLVSHRVSRALVDRGFFVRFATPSEGSFNRIAESIGPVDLVPENTLRQIGHVRNVSKYLRSVNASLVHTHTPIAASLIWRLAARLAGVPVIHHVHSANFYGRAGIKSMLAKRLDLMTIGIPVGFVAVSRDTADGIVLHGYPPSRVTTIYNPIPGKQAPRHRPSLTAEPVIGCVGRVSHMKGQLELIDAFARVRTEFPGAKLWIIGPAEADEREYLERLGARIETLRLGDVVKILGYRNDVSELMRELTVLALPSRHEAFPLVLLEAMSIGLPVVATPVGGVRELVEDRVTGLMVPPGDPKELSTAIGELFRSQSLRESLSKAGYESVWSRFHEHATLDPLVSMLAAEASSAYRD